MEGYKPQDVVEMNANKRNVSRKGVTALIAISAIAMMFMALLPAAAIPGSNMATVMGTVTDYNNGEPIEDAQVVISYHGTVRTVYTDAQGKYEFNNVPECYCLKTVNVTKEHFRPLSEDVAVSDVTIVDFQLWIEEGEPPMGTVEGTVTDVHNGEPIEGAQLQLQYHDNIRKTISDADGKYKFTQVDECRCFKNIKVTKESYRPESEDIAVSGVTVVDFQLMVEEGVPPAGTLSGTVTDVNNGEPVEGATVQLMYNDHFRETTTDADGKYRFDDVPEAWNPKKVLVTKELYRPESKDIDVEGDTIVDFQLMIEELPPTPNGGTLTGVVTDSVTDEPIEGATVMLEYHEKTLTVQTDEGGRYTFQGIPICFCLKDLSVSMDGYLPQTMSLSIDEGTVKDIAMEPTDRTGSIDPPVTNGSDGRTATDPGVLMSWAIIGLIVSLAGGALFVITTRLQNRS